MAYEVIATTEFQNDLEGIIDWLKHEWTIKEVDRFKKKLRSVIQIISQNPKVGKISFRQNDIRSFMITPHNRLYYQVFQKHITLHNIVETKRNPKRNKFE